MQELNFLIRESLVNGLEPDPRSPRNAPHMVEMAEMKPSPWGAVSPETVVYPIESPALAMDWPFPQVFRGEKKTLLCLSTAIYEVDESDWTTAAITPYQAASTGSTLTIVAGGPWTMASFQDCWFLTNGTTFLWSLPSNEDGKVLGTTALTVQGMCSVNNRLILSGLAHSGGWLAGSRFSVLFDVWKETIPDDWFAHETLAFDDRYVVWSEYGGGSSDLPFHNLLLALGVFNTTRFDAMDTLLLDAIEKGDIGFCPTSSPGTCKAVLPLGEDVLAFGVNGVFRLFSQQLRYKPKMIFTTGVLSRSAVCGDGVGREAVWIDTTRTLFRWQSGEGPRELNKGYFDAYVAADTVISYDPHEQDYWITDGVRCYIRSLTGLGGPFVVMPTHLFRASNGDLIGAAENLDDTTFAVRLVTSTLDINERGTKHVTTFQVQAEGVTSLAGTTAFRYDHSQAFVELASLSNANPKGVIYMNISFVDGRVVLEGTTTGAGEIRQIEFRYNAEDRTHRRGTKGTPQGD